MKELADLIVDHYERQARGWDADRRTLPCVDRPWIELFAGLLPAGARVLDLDGGDRVLTSLTAHGLKVTGVDGSPTLISPRKASGSPWA